MDAHDEEEFGEFEGFAEKEASVEAHAVELPVVTTGDDDDGGVAGAVMAAQDFVEGGTIEVGEADVEQDEVGLEVGNALEGLLPIVEEGEVPVGVVFEGVTKKRGELGIVFDDGDDFGGWCGWLGIVWLQYIVSHVYVLPGLYDQVPGQAQDPHIHSPLPTVPTDKIYQLGVDVNGWVDEVAWRARARRSARMLVKCSGRAAT